MEASGWKYMFPSGDCVPYTDNLMGERVYWTTAIFKNSQENHVVFNIHMKRLLSYFILELLLTLSVLMITLMFCSS